MSKKISLWRSIRWIPFCLACFNHHEFINCCWASSLKWSHLPMKVATPDQKLPLVRLSEVNAKGWKATWNKPGYSLTAVFQKVFISDFPHFSTCEPLVTKLQLLEWDWLVTATDTTSVPLANWYCGNQVTNTDRQSRQASTSHFPPVRDCRCPLFLPPCAVS